MVRPLVLSVTALLFMTSCTAAFRDRRTPSGGFCTDMAVIPSNEEPDLEYHRLQPVQSELKQFTSAERFESLRKAACAVGADAVIEAEEDNKQNEVGQFVKIFTGTAVVWVRPAGESDAKPLTTHKKKKEPKADGSEATPVSTTDAPPPPPETASAPPPPTATAAPAPPPTATPTASAAASAAPTATTKPKSKLPTNPAPKPVTKPK